MTGQRGNPLQSQEIDELARRSNLDVEDPPVVAPDFELSDVHGNRVRLSSYRGKSPVLLVLLRGFV